MKSRQQRTRYSDRIGAPSPRKRGGSVGVMMVSIGAMEIYGGRVSVRIRCWFRELKARFWSVERSREGGGGIRWRTWDWTWSTYVGRNENGRKMAFIYELCHWSSIGDALYLLCGPKQETTLIWCTRRTTWHDNAGVRVCKFIFWLNVIKYLAEFSRKDTFVK